MKTDSISNVVAAPVKFWWDFVSLVLTCTAVGLPLALTALASENHVPWLVVLLSLVAGGFLLWLAAAQRRKYLKWVRVDPEG